MSFGSLSANAKEALGRGAAAAGTSTTTGDGGMSSEERGQSKTLVYQYLPSRYGMNPDDLRKADAIEIVIGQGAKPGGRRHAARPEDHRPRGRDANPAEGHRSAVRRPSPRLDRPRRSRDQDHELREITDWEKPIYVKVGGARPYYDVALAVKAGADVVVVDGMQGAPPPPRRSSSRTSACRRWPAFVRRPGSAGARHAPQGAAHRVGRHPQRRRCRESPGARADAVAIGTAALVALGDNDPLYESEYRALGTTAGAYDDWHEGKDPAGITTQDPALMARLDPVLAGRRLAIT